MNRFYSIRARWQEKKSWLMLRSAGESPDCQPQFQDLFVFYIYRALSATHMVPNSKLNPLNWSFNHARCLGRVKSLIFLDYHISVSLRPWRRVDLDSLNLSPCTTEITKANICKVFHHGLLLSIFLKSCDCIVILHFLSSVVHLYFLNNFSHLTSAMIPLYCCMGN